MSDIDFSKKISFQRPFSKPKDKKDAYAIEREFESDRGRIINSAAIRRLQQKTQVFPLERNAAVRSRLTHSMEVQQVGRYIAKEILGQLRKSGQLGALGLGTLETPFESLIEMACLMHDIGNPPFGHFGEAAINNWFSQRLAPEGKPPGAGEDPCQVACLRLDDEGEAELNALRSRIRHDLSNFEGNAQAIRLVHSLLKLNLTYAQVGCILKYTKPAYWAQPIPHEYSYLMKKAGFYLSEETFVRQLRSELEMGEFHRHPLTYIMEAADDISYCIADLEDAVEKKIVTYQQLYERLEDAWGTREEKDVFSRTIERAYTERQHMQGRSESDQFFMKLRVNTVNTMVGYVTRRFIEHLPAIYDGSFNRSLLEEDKDDYGRLLKIFKDVARKFVFNHHEVEQLELQGDRIISGLLEIYSPLLNMPYHDFCQLVNDDTHKRYPIETRLYHKLSSKHCHAYREATCALPALPAAEQEVWEYYYRARLILDYISGMTDLYAYDEYRRLMAVD
ncbi:dGTPase [Dickeya dadantii]|uniref:dGTPase n=1 Tax=Dickeya dadantii TaxID=204038 RepID=UPI0013730359|nr:dGTPase [Dickeya dadantii]NAT78230.1 dGTPase [Dickeya dadantii]NPE56187.1 dGTPase [Dickeya dadantii]NPE63278.1 dGTPase [Dickeya dadantii]NPE67778.1 dGTPase [Dickeya dadantii]